MGAVRARSGVGTRSVGTATTPIAARPKRGRADDPTGVLDLQRTAGNRAVTVLLQRDRDALAERAAAVDRSNAERLFAKGDRAYRAGQWLVAADYFGRVYELLPHPHIAFSQAQALRRGGRAKEAIRLFQVYLDAEPKGSRARDARDFIRELSGERGTGDAKADRAGAERAYRRGERAYRAKAYGAAVVFFRQAYALLPHPQLAFTLAQAMRLAGGHAAEARSLYQRYVDEDPRGTRAKHARSFIVELTPAEKTGDEKSDRAAAERVFKRAETSYRARRFLAAADLFAEVHALLPVPEILFSRAQALRRAGGHATEAIALFLEFAKAMPTHRRAKEAREFALKLSSEGAAS